MNWDWDTFYSVALVVIILVAIAAIVPSKYDPAIRMKNAAERKRRFFQVDWREGLWDRNVYHLVPDPSDAFPSPGYKQDMMIARRDGKRMTLDDEKRAKAELVRWTL